MIHLTNTRRAGGRLLGARRRVASRLGPAHSGAASTSCELGTRNSELRTRVARRGVSLLEVLVSMGIIAIGLLGVAAMFPVGASKVQKAVEHDRAAALGQAAFHEIKIRGLLNPAANPASPQPGEWMESVGFGGVGTNFAVAVDPMGCAGDVLGSELFPFRPSSGWSPYSSPLGFKLRRVSFPSVVSTGVISKTTAEFVMASHDDLVFDRPDDRDAPAVQLNKVDSASGNNVHRQFEGQFSWMFTAVPQLGSTDRYNVSVVVFHGRRVVTDDDGDSMIDDPKNVPERMVQTVPGSVVGGIGGLEANLYTTGPKEYLERIKPGHWVMLSAQVGTTASSRQILKWYRIVSLEDEIQGTGPYTRWISLAGSDLNPPSGTSWTQWLDINGGGIDPAQGEGVLISLFDNAIAVYERTMRVEGSSMY